MAAPRQVLITMSNEPKETDWWGQAEVPLNHSLSRRIGPLELEVVRLDLEWCLTWQTHEDPLDNQLQLKPAATFRDLPVLENNLRVGDPTDDRTVELIPALADRPVVSRVDAPFTVLPGDEITVFVSTPLWLRVVADTGRPLLEVPFYRPSDTWFGPSTRVGELCYASRTHCRLHPDELPTRPHRSVTSISIRNRATDPLLIERIMLPVANLSLFARADGRLWTDDVVMRRELEDTSTTVHVSMTRGRERSDGDVTVAEPREKVADRGIGRVFGSLFG